MATGQKRARGCPRLDFEVTQAHIDTAVPKDSGHCMIADALAEAYPTAQNISVDLATIRFTDPAAGWRYIYLTPVPAQIALIDFDQGEDKPEPFRVRQQAAQMVPTGTARKSMRQKLLERGEEPPARVDAELWFPTGKDSGSVPVKVGGKPLPQSELATGRGGVPANAVRRGRRREFGLRALIR